MLSPADVFEFDCFTILFYPQQSPPTIHVHADQISDYRIKQTHAQFANTHNCWQMQQYQKSE